MQSIEDILESPCIHDLKYFTLGMKDQCYRLSHGTSICIGKRALACGMAIDTPHKNALGIIFEWTACKSRCYCVDKLTDIVELIIRNRQIKNPYFMLGCVNNFCSKPVMKQGIMNMYEDCYKFFKYMKYDINTPDKKFTGHIRNHSLLVECHMLLMKYGCKYENLSPFTKKLWLNTRYTQYVYSLCIKYGFPRYKSCNVIYLDGLYPYKDNGGRIFRKDLIDLVYCFGKISDIELLTFTLHCNSRKDNLSKYLSRGLPSSINKKGNIMGPKKSHATRKYIYSLKCYVKRYIISREDTVFDLDDKYNVVLWR